MTDTLIKSAMVVYFGSGLLLTLQLWLAHLAYTSALKSCNPEWKAEACAYFEKLTRLKGGICGTLALTMIAPWVAVTRLKGSIW